MTLLILLLLQTNQSFVNYESSYYFPAKVQISVAPRVTILKLRFFIIWLTVFSPQLLVDLPPAL